MTPTEADLYRRICDFELDPSKASFPFSAKLSWEYRWTGIFTKSTQAPSILGGVLLTYRAIQEYKKFVFLSQVANHQVSPSTIVDRVWHLHLLYTHSYWNEFCGKVLNQPLHHVPSLGGKSEGLKYRYQYQQTLTSYTHYFGTPPPDIWNAPKLRGEPISYQWVSRSQYWLVPKISNLLNGLSFHKTKI